MKAFILAGGLDTRLTEIISKPLLLVVRKICSENSNGTIKKLIIIETRGE